LPDFMPCLLTCSLLQLLLGPGVTAKKHPTATLHCLLLPVYHPIPGTRRLCLLPPFHRYHPAAGCFTLVPGLAAWWSIPQRLCAALPEGRRANRYAAGAAAEDLVRWR